MPELQNLTAEGVMIWDGMNVNITLPEPPKWYTFRMASKRQRVRLRIEILPDE